ncbi:MAG: hypothetical protein GXP53_05025 [Deltaproteobacteria bacterium]|nr:hypothetical protein [Deltaproteobacteria bacterium]
MMVKLLPLFFITCMAGPLIGAILPDKKNPAVIAFTGAVSSLILLWLSGSLLLSGRTFVEPLWYLAPFGKLVIEIDRISALFLFICGLVFFPVSIFSAGYMKQYIGKYSLKSFNLFFHLLFASVVLILIAGDIFLFFIAWEAMSILCYLLVNYEHEDDEKTRSGFLMLAMSEAGTIAALLAFITIANGHGDIAFAALRSDASALGHIARWAVFLLSFFGFGVKAGLIPVSSWIPFADPASPRNISAILSGVILNLGIYGIVRINMDILPISFVGPGLIMLIMGTVSALVGILYATPERDMKKMLAHSSIENMGITIAGLGAGFIFASSGQPALAGIAFIAAFYHMANHSIYKGLLFLGAGAIDCRAGGCHNMDRLGGLIKKMPWTSLFFLTGALSIAGMPPFNGFVSEWLTLQSLLQCSVLSSKAIKIVFVLCGAGLALTAALAVTCFVKAFGMSFLGMARSKQAENAVEADKTMTVSMGILAALCLLLGILPTYVIPVMDHVTQPYVHQSVTDELVPPFFTVGTGNNKFPKAFVSDFHALGAQIGANELPGRGLVIMHRGAARNPVIFAMSPSYSVVMLILLLSGAFVVVRLFTKGRALVRKPAWSGGIRKLIPDITYTATGFSNPVRVIFATIFRPITISDPRETVSEHFRSAIKRDRKEVHLVDRLLGKPLFRGGRYIADLLAKMHSGSVNAYAAYVIMSLLIVLAIQIWW